MVANRIDGRAEMEEPERESLVVVEEDSGLGGAEERERSEIEVREPLVSRPSIGIEPLSESVVTPQIPLSSPRSESKRLREEKKAGGARDELKKVSRLLGGGDGDQLVRGGERGVRRA